MIDRADIPIEELTAHTLDYMGLSPGEFVDVALYSVSVDSLERLTGYARDAFEDLTPCEIVGGMIENNIYPADFLPGWWE